MPAPANDLCANAIVISSLPYTSASIDKTLATESGGDPTFSVAGTGTIAGGAAVFNTTFWTYTPGSNQRVRFSCSNSSVALGVFTGSCGSLTEIASWTDGVTLELTSGTA